jgi:hypothetical protein
MEKNTKRQIIINIKLDQLKKDGLGVGFERVEPKFKNFH